VLFSVSVLAAIFVCYGLAHSNEAREVFSFRPINEYGNKGRGLVHWFSVLEGAQI